MAVGLGSATATGAIVADSQTMSRVSRWFFQPLGTGARVGDHLNII